MRVCVCFCFGPREMCSLVLVRAWYFSCFRATFFFFFSLSTAAVARGVIGKRGFVSWRRHVFVLFSVLEISCEN